MLRVALLVVTLLAERAVLITGAALSMLLTVTVLAAVSLLLFLNQSVYVPFAETVLERLYDLADDEIEVQELGVVVEVLPLSTL